MIELHIGMYWILKNVCNCQSFYLQYQKPKDKSEIFSREPEIYNFFIQLFLSMYYTLHYIECIKTE